MSATRLWNLVNFDDRLDEWIGRVNPDEGRRFVVAEWLLGVMDDPYRGMRREPAFDSLWFGPVPGTERADSTVVACSYWILERTHTVRCDSFAVLGLPL